METLTNGETPDLMANLELMEMLEESIKAREGKRTYSKLKNRDWIESKVLEYLKSSRCTQLEAEKAPQLVERLQGEKKDGFGLTEAETLQVINLMPSESVEIHLMIEDLPSRMTDEKQEELLNFVASFRQPDETENQKKDESEEIIEEMDMDMDIDQRVNGYEEDVQKLEAKSSPS
uniref:DNA-directed RNA polymerase III subunit RPC9 n=2 Tax=Cyclophora tenuis TaxID=216820 RepID=A0A7S1DDV3_CYCTE|mmetsp:Transcript_9665/g.16136  ORF Transcript_9665/g.16136 Transcript_9665/m.16136 type:complete len:176 (+) Transcript_9665:100-627(+)